MIRHCAIGAICALSAVSAAKAEETVTWATDIAGWEVAVDRTIGDSCFIVSALDNDFVLRLQFNNRQKNIQFIIGSLRWSSVEEGAHYDMEVAFGGGSPWTGDGVGYLWNDILPSLVLSVPVGGEKASFFLNEFAAPGELRVAFDDTEIRSLPLEGTREALSEMMACQKVMLSNLRPEESALPGAEKL